jgi:hypothetical protein
MDFLNFLCVQEFVLLGAGIVHEFMLFLSVLHTFILILLTYI